VQRANKALGKRKLLVGTYNYDETTHLKERKKKATLQRSQKRGTGGYNQYNSVHKRNPRGKAGRMSKKVETTASYELRRYLKKPQ